MNSFARRGVESSPFVRMLKRSGRTRQRTLVAAVLGTFFCFAAFFHHYEQINDDSTIFTWFGMRSDGRCGRDFGMEHVKEITCGKGACCSSHGWCGHGEEYCSVALGCQNGCWPADPNARPETPDDEPDDRYRHHMMDDDGGYYRDRDRYDDYRHGDYHHDDYHHRYDDMHPDHDEPDHEVPGDHDDHDEG